MKSLSSILGGIGTVILLAASSQAAPRLVLGETTFNFGAVPQNSKVSHVFWLHSAGDDTLQILKVTPGCGCTQTPLERSSLAAGDSTRLEVIFDTKHYTGKISKRPRIETNEGPPEKYIQFDCEVMNRPDSTYPIIIKPYKIDISQFGEKVRDQMKFTITNVSDKPLTLSLISSSDVCTVQLPSSIDAGKMVEGLVKLSRDALKKEFEKSLTFEAGGDQPFRFTIPVKRALRLPGDTTQEATPQAMPVETK